MHNSQEMMDFLLAALAGPAGDGLPVTQLYETMFGPGLSAEVTPLRVRAWAAELELEPPALAVELGAASVWGRGPMAKGGVFGIRLKGAVHCWDAFSGAEPNAELGVTKRVNRLIDAVVASIESLGGRGDAPFLTIQSEGPQYSAPMQAENSSLLAAGRADFRILTL